MKDPMSTLRQEPEFDQSRPHPARVYDYALGGKNHFAADREVAEKAWAVMPTARIGARENRSFLGCAVRYLAAEAGIRQFLDIGTGLPSTGNVHEVAQAVAPESRVVYVDNDRCKPGCTHAAAAWSSGQVLASTAVDRCLAPQVRSRI